MPGRGARSTLGRLPIYGRGIAMTTNSEQEIIEMPCLECGKPVKVRRGGHEESGVFNVFCPDKDKDCEDRYAWKQ